jgi:hypothetical protein
MMDERIRKHFEMHWHGKQKVMVSWTATFEHIFNWYLIDSFIF